jgi:preprotein translocase subunit SecB
MTKMKLSPLQLDSCQFTEVSLFAQPNAKEEDAKRFDLNVVPDVFQRIPENVREWCIILNVEIKAQEGSFVPYIGQIEAFGTFLVDISWPEDQIEKLVYINGSGVLYASIREMVCSITARGFWDMLILPSWSFSQAYNERQTAKELEAKKLQGAAPIPPATPPASSPPEVPST